MQKIGFLGMGVMGLPMAKNVVQKCGLPVLGYDVVQQQMDAFREAGGIPVSDPAEIYKACDVILQILPTHPIIRNSVEQAIQYGKPGNVIVDLSSTAPDIILELYQQAKDAGMFLLDSPVSGGNPMAIAGTLAIMTGGDKEAFDKVKPVLACMGSPVYTGGPASETLTGLIDYELYTPDELRPYFDKAFEEHIMPAIHYGKSCILKEADYYYHLFADDEWEEFLEKLKED